MYQYDFLFRPLRALNNIVALFFPHQHSLFLDLIFVAPYLNKEVYPVSYSDRMTEEAEI